MNINLIWDSNALAAPQSFRDGVQAAASVLEAAIDNPITVNISIGYGEYDEGGPQSQPLTGDFSLGGINTEIDISYTALTNAMAGVASSLADYAELNSLPKTTALQGKNTFYISTAQAKAFGALPADGSGIDGYAGFPTSFTGSTLLGAAIVELTHALGFLSAGGGALSLVQYTSPGEHLLINTDISSTPAYFSLNGGATDLANYNVGNDTTLFENLSDAYNDPISGVSTLSALDIEELDAVGYNTNADTPPPSPSITPIVTGGSEPEVDTRNQTLAAGTSVTAASFITSVAEPSSGSVASYDFYVSGTGGGYFSLDGVAQPVDQYFGVLSTQLGSLDYVTGATPGTQQNYVTAFDIDTDTFGNVSAFSVTTEEEHALCFTAGTLIRTPRGDTAIENLAIGDLVTTPAGPRPVKWLGRRSYDGALLGNHHLVLPVTIRKHAIAPNRPARDLQVSPGHGICVSDGRGRYLVPAWRLVNGVSIIQPACAGRIDYLHIELEHHALLVAENLSAESFYETAGLRRQFHNAAEFDQLYPAGGDAARMCLPRIEHGFILRDIQNRIARRAGIKPQHEQPNPAGLRGFVDQAHDGWVTGWAQDVTQPDVPVTIAVKLNGAYAAYGLANRYRKDLRAAGIGDGCHGFAFQLPATGSIAVCRAVTGTPLNFYDAAQG